MLKILINDARRLKIPGTFTRGGMVGLRWAEPHSTPSAPLVDVSSSRTYN